MKAFSLCIFLILSGIQIHAQENLDYQKPPKEILDLVDYERPPSVNMDSKKEVMLFMYRDTYKTLEDLNQEEIRLAGLRINPIINISSTVTYITNLKTRKLNETSEVQVTGLPTNPRISNVTWSPDEKKIAFTHSGTKALELWVLDLTTHSCKKLSELALNANLGSPITWFKDGNSLLVHSLPKNRQPLINTKTTLPSGPVVTLSDGSKAQNRTYQDLLKNPTDEKNFENLATSELYKVSLTGQVEKWMEADMYMGESISPDGKYFLITTIERPFSYLVTYDRFPSREIVYDIEAKKVAEVNFTPLLEVLPQGFMATYAGNRDFSWRSDHPAMLMFVRALDRGDPEVKVDFRDEVFLLNAPFTGQEKSLLKTKQRFSGIIWGDETHAIAYDNWWNTRNTKTYFFDPTLGNASMKILFDRNSDDKYSDPGRMQTKPNEYGENVLLLKGHEVYLFGDGFKPEGQFPFIQSINLLTGVKKELYRSTYTDKVESLSSFIDPTKGTVLVRIESPKEFPNYYVRTISKPKSKPTQITNFKNPFTLLEKVHKEVIKYKRSDGLELTGTLYLPSGYDRAKKEKLPMIMWAYPKEFKDKSSAGQITTNPNQFTFPSYGSPIYWVTRGYAVLDNASFPIVGEGDTEPNDSFITQLVDNAKAAIDAVDTLGYIDRSKVAVGGHSYGAFMTANLLTHSDLFTCGVARSGAYNRTLTPFGFQSEERNYWEAQNVYNDMSPFMTADKMNHPLLLVHGEADNNPGTFTLQSERYFNALKGLGKPARLVILPKESHGYVAKENILHLLWEQDRWFEMYLKK
ncbi:MAG: prolyl oligopeptidase family serine peptidase [Flavobacteriia bacterium]